MKNSSGFRWSACGLLVLAALSCLLLMMRLRAANPTAGAISPSSSPIAWDGTAAAGASATGEMTCVEMPGVQVNCDTFTLTVNGTPAQWSGKQVEVEISWVVLASDYDLYLHKGSNAGPTIAQSTGSAPGTNEIVHINGADLDSSGSTVFTVHVVYSAAAAGDQYHGAARVVTAAGGATPTPAPIAKSKNWKINYHGQCCEGNLAAAGNNTYVLLPVLVNGNKIKRSTDGGQSWTETYPPAPVSFPFGIEGDMQAFGSDVIFFGTELADAVVAKSTDGGLTWLTVQVPLASGGNDQAWSYLGPFGNLNPVPAPTDAPYVLAGWMRIGTALAFSFNGGLTWTTQTPLVGDDGSGPEHVVCHQNATDPPLINPGDTRVANQNFRHWKGGRYGTWGTDGKFYWAETVQDPAGDLLYVCQTNNFGVTWTGTKHPLAPGPGSQFVVNHSVFDNNGTLYVLHGNKLYVSFNQGKTFAFTHTLPRFGNAGRSDSGADQSLAVDCGTVHVGLLEDAGNGNGRVFYLRGTRVDTANPNWDQELVDEVGNVRLDFMYIVVDGNGVPTISYTTPGQQVTTASRNAPMPALAGSTCSVASISAVSRKAHNGIAQPFEVPLPLDGPPGIEPRNYQDTRINTHQIVFKFGVPITFTGASVTPEGNGTAELDGNASFNAVTNEVTVNLKNVSNAQTITVTLLGLTGGGTPANISVRMGVLLGDVDATAVVTTSDVQLTSSRALQPVDDVTFRSDVDCTGAITTSDIQQIQANALTRLNTAGQNKSTSRPSKRRR